MKLKISILTLAICFGIVCIAQNVNAMKVNSNENQQSISVTADPNDCE